MAAPAGKPVMAVTGANKGIGYEIARRLLADHPDATVLVTARNEERGKAAVDSLDNPRAKFMALDVADPSSITAWASRVAAEHGRLDVLVLNAGVLGRDPAETGQSVNVNYFGVLRTVRAAEALLHPGSRVVAVSSRLGSLAAQPGEDLRATLTDPDLAVDRLSEVMEGAVAAAEADGAAGLTAAGWSTDPYVVSKVGVTTLMRLLGRDARPPGVAYHAACPGLTDTGGNTDAIKGLPGIVPLAQGADTIMWATTLGGGEGNGGFVADRRRLDYTDQADMDTWKDGVPREEFVKVA